MWAPRHYEQGFATSWPRYRPDYPHAGRANSSVSRCDTRMAGAGADGRGIAYATKQEAKSTTTMSDLMAISHRADPQPHGALLPVQAR
jgi:hypothetical protein